MQIILLLVVCSNVLLALIVFVLLGKPSVFEGGLSRLVGLHLEWQFGTLSGDDAQRIEQLGIRLGRIGLVVLFVWSFLSGLLLRILAI